MKPLKKRIRQYMLRIMGMLIVLSMVSIACIQVYAERHREHEKSLGVLTQIEQFIVDNVIAEDTAGASGQSAYENMFSLIRVNSDADYYVIAEEDGKILGATVKSAIGSSCEELGLRLDKVRKDTNGFYAKMSDARYYCVFQKVGTEYVGRCVDCEKLYQRVPATLLVLGICLVMIGGILAYAVSRYMNRYVVDEIHEINDKLCLIAEGDMEEKVDIRTSEEFSELSDYINTMVGNLSDTTSKISYVLSKTNMFIGVYEYRKVQSRFVVPSIFRGFSLWSWMSGDFLLRTMPCLMNLLIKSVPIPTARKRACISFPRSRSSMLNWRKWKSEKKCSAW